MDTRPVLLGDVQRRVNRVSLVRTALSHWLLWVVLVLGIYNALPFFAPVAMRFGWGEAGNLIYNLYSTQCHQMAQRSFFLFGSQVMYSIDALPVNAAERNALLSLREYRGDETLGWKVAWSDRMVYMYGSLWLSALIYGFWSRRHFVRPLPFWTFLLFLLPMALDGTTHLLSDVSGLTDGFRYDNAWLASLTNDVFPSSFYVGDAFGSFNSYARMISGVLFGFGIVWVFFPWVDQEVRRTVLVLDEKLTRFQHYVEAVGMNPLRHSGKRGNDET